MEERVVREGRVWEGAHTAGSRHQQRGARTVRPLANSRMEGQLHHMVGRVQLSEHSRSRAARGGVSNIVCVCVW